MLADLTNDPNVTILVFWCGLGALVGWAIGHSKGRGADGLMIGLFLGVIGWVIAGTWKPRVEPTGPSTPTRRCPWCAEEIQTAAVVCRHCGRDVPALGQSDPQWANDPYGRFEFRFWDGTTWTNQVSTGGRSHLDIPGKR